ncbi:MAG: sensor histidine kinase [Vicinamibacterales bacterium]
MRPLPLRTSLTLAYTAILSVALTAVGIGFHAIMVRQLDASVTSALQEKARALHGYLRFSNGTPVLSYDADDPEEAAFVDDATRYYQVYEAESGQLLTQSAGMESLGLHYTPAEVAELRAQPGAHDVQTDIGRLRLTTSVIAQADGQAYVVQVGEPLAAIDRTLASFDRLLWVRVAIGVAVALILGPWLAGRALAPLSRLAAETRAIGIDRLSDRVGVRHTGDELDRVASAFNDALARVERSVGEMRQFSAALAHELRTPIAILRGEGELELADPSLPEDRRRRVESQLEEYERLTRLIDQILTLARAEAGETPLRLAPVDVGRITAAIVEQIEPVARAKSLALHCGTSGELTIEGDEGWIGRLLLLLLDNAIKFTPAGGNVSVQASRSGDDVILVVADTGIGVPPEAVPHLFERFYRAERARPRASSEEGASGEGLADAGPAEARAAGAEPPGAGLGLALAKWIAERHRATIGVESRPGEGAAFTVRFRPRDR